jgi:hypothetical protein
MIYRRFDPFPSIKLQKAERVISCRSQRCGINLINFLLPDWEGNNPEHDHVAGELEYPNLQNPKAAVTVSATWPLPIYGWRYLSNCCEIDVQCDLMIGRFVTIVVCNGYKSIDMNCSIVNADVT